MLDDKQEAGIAEHMNVDHADELLAYARAFAGHAGASAARMTTLEAERMTLSITLDCGDVEVDIPFPEPVTSPGAAPDADPDGAGYAMEAIRVDPYEF